MIQRYESLAKKIKMPDKHINTTRLKHANDSPSEMHQPSSANNSVTNESLNSKKSSNNLKSIELTAVTTVKCINLTDHSNGPENHSKEESNDRKLINSDHSTQGDVRLYQSPSGAGSDNLVTLGPMGQRNKSQSPSDTRRDSLKTSLQVRFNTNSESGLAPSLTKVSKSNMKSIHNDRILVMITNNKRANSIGCPVIQTRPIQLQRVVVLWEAN